MEIMFVFHSVFTCLRILLLYWCVWNCHTENLNCCQSSAFQMMLHHNHINFDKLPNSTGLNAAPNHDKLHCVLQIATHCCASLLLNSSIHIENLNQRVKILTHHSILTVATNLLSSSIVFIKNAFLVATLPL